jgi:hypothetical protein
MEMTTPTLVSLALAMAFAAQEAPRSPYAGEESRPIKALSEGDV